METTHYSLQPGASRVVIRTRAEGMLSALAHDLEIEGTPRDGEGARTGSEWSARVTLRAETLRVSGVVEHGSVRTMSPRDRAEIERRIREEVFRTLPEVTVHVRGTDHRGEADVQGTKGNVQVPLILDDLRTDGDTVVAQGRLSVSIRALGLPVIKGPLGAFRVADEVEVRFRAVFEVQKTSSVVSSS